MVWGPKDRGYQVEGREEVIVTLKDVRAAKMCAKGAREFFKRHNLDWSAFVKDGIDSEILEMTGDAMALKVVEVARARG